MKWMIMFSFFLIPFFITGCMQAHSDDDLRGVPITNNPNILPKTTSMPRF